MARIQRRPRRRPFNSLSAAGRPFPHARDRLLRRRRRRTRPRLALCGFVGAARPSAAVEPREGVRLGVAVRGGARPDEGRTDWVDGSTMAADATLRTTARRDDGERYRETLSRMVQESGGKTPSGEDLARFGRTRAGFVLLAFAVVAGNPAEVPPGGVVSPTAARAAVIADAAGRRRKASRRMAGRRQAVRSRVALARAHGARAHRRRRSLADAARGAGVSAGARAAGWRRRSLTDAVAGAMPTTGGADPARRCRRGEGDRRHHCNEKYGEVAHLRLRSERESRPCRSAPARRRAKRV